MKRILSLISLLLILVMLPLGAFGCNKAEPHDTEPTQEPTQKPTETEEVIKGIELDLVENADKLKIWGRYQLTSNGIACDHTASGIEFSGTMRGKVYVDIRCASAAYFTVFIDGVRQSKRHCVSGGRRAVRLTVADFDEEGEHNIRILKQTESRYTTAEFRTLIIDGELNSAPSQNDTYIEFIGDSLTCGMGNLGNTGNTSAQNAIYEDGTFGYAFLAAEQLGADCSIISQSGIGIAGSWFDPIKEFYTKLSYSRDTVTEYDFERIPDMVVINLGTNDYHLNKKDNTVCTPEQVREEAKALIELVRSSYGSDVPIVWCYGFMGECMYNAVRTAIDELGGEAAGIYTCKLSENHTGAENHPGKAGHMTAAQELKNFILGLENK